MLKKPLKQYFTEAFGRPAKRILVLRALFLGDLLCAVPAFRALRAAFPEAELTLLGLPWSQEFVRRYNHLLDRYAEFPGFPGIPERPFDPNAFAAFIAATAAKPFDLIFQLHGDGSHLNEFVNLLGAKVTCGFYRSGNWCPDQRFYLAYPDKCTELTRHLHLLDFVGIPLRGEELEFPIMRRDLESLSGLLHDHELRNRPYIVIHPGAKSAKRWSSAGLAKVADHFQTQGVVVLLTGTASEREVVDEVQRQMRTAAVNLCGRTDLGTMAALLARARLVICHDTGVSHLASALKVPSLVIFLGLDLEVWMPKNPALNRTVGRVGTLQPETVIAEAQRLLMDQPKHTIPGYVMHLNKNNLPPPIRLVL